MAERARQTGSMPAHDEQAEQVVLAELLLKPEQFDQVAWLGADRFYFPHHKAVMEAIAELWGNSHSVDAVAVATWLRDHDKHRLGAEYGGSYGAYLTKLYEQIPAADIEQHARTVHQKWQLRQTASVCRQAAALAGAPHDNPQTLIEETERRLVEIAEINQPVVLEPAHEIMDRHLSVLTAARERGVRILGTPTGFYDLDELTGGLFGGDLYLVASRPGVGKTTFVSNLALNVAMADEGQVAVAFFSLEMPKEQIVTRLACTQQGIEFAPVRTGRMSPAHWSGLAQAAMDLRRVALWVDDTPALSVGALRARVRKLMRDIARGRAGRAQRLGLVVVDYLQLMTGQRERGDSREREVASISQGLKNLAKELHVPVLGVSQLSRAVEKTGRSSKRPQLSDLRESGGLEQDADSVWFLFRESYYDRKADQGEAELNVAKQRNGPTGALALRFESRTLKFHSVGKDEYDEYDEFGRNGA